MAKPIPPAIRDWINYNPETGEFIWRRSPANNVPQGSVAGFLSADGYYNIRFNKSIYKAHRIAWYLIYNTDPVVEIDHKNEIKNDNRLVNLRLATSSENQYNRSIRSNNTSGIKGVSWHERAGKWQVQIRKDSKVVFTGHYHSLEQAEKIAIAKRLEFHGEFANHG